MTPEEARKKLEDRKKANNVGGSTMEPNPATLTLKWANYKEEVPVEGGRKAQLPSGKFQFQKKNEAGVWEKFDIPQKKFAIAIIEHNIVMISGLDIVNKHIDRRYWSNEMRMQDLMVSPFILKIQGSDKAVKASTYFGTWKELKEDHDIKGRMHVIYGITPQGALIKLILPYYSYTLGNDKFKTHGDTLLDADAKSIKAGNGGIENCFLTYDGFTEMQQGSNTFTAPKFCFNEKLTDEMIVQMSEVADTFDAWYKAYHQSNIAYYDKLTKGGDSNQRDETHQGESRHGSENQDTASPAVVADPDWDDDEENQIPF